MTYTLGKDAKNEPLAEEKYYIYIETGEIIQLHRDSAGFRVDVDGRPVNISNLEEGSNYRLATEQDLRGAIEKCDARKGWLASGLVEMLKKIKPTEQELRQIAIDGEFSI